ncbi:unnamed protein product [Linum tenue]|uniref:TLC domain-containing protein n=1 Tax=Linum tenue TaxID=586396 RepID=A0AAV0Q6U2_9ROSI|nr:unnamed protein product [Linum tenue]
MVTMPKETVMAIEAYRSQAKLLVKSYLFAGPFVAYTSVLGGVVACKVVHPLYNLIYMSWGVSSLHAIFITALSLYFVFWSDLFSDKVHTGYVTLRSSPLSIFGLVVSVGYFLADLGMILWFYPSLGGMEYVSSVLSVVHHCLSARAVAYSMLSGEGQLYTYMCLISEVTMPEINMRWYEASTAYLVNGVLIFLFWLIARVMLFFYIFYHINMHFDHVGGSVLHMRWFGCMEVVMVPSSLFIMNLMWFAKIIKGLMKTLAKRQ